MGHENALNSRRKSKKGSVSVTIYETPTKGYPSYTLAYYQKGQRKRETSADYTAILNRADEVLKDLEAGRDESDLPSVVASRETLHARAVKKLHSGCQLRRGCGFITPSPTTFWAVILSIQASREYKQRHGTGLTPMMMVPDVVTRISEHTRAAEPKRAAHANPQIPLRPIRQCDAGAHRHCERGRRCLVSR